MLYFYQCAFNLEKFVQFEDEVYETCFKIIAFARKKQ
jgi:hypothetical protein